MRCPFCGNEDTQVKDSRPTDDNSAIRRRRQCPNCGARFTTFERVQLRELTVVKTTGQREPFDRDKLMRSMQIALRKRPVDSDRIERVVNGIVRRLASSVAIATTTELRDDLVHMRAAFALARRGLGRTWPNPAVGCILVKDGRVV